MPLFHCLDSTKGSVQPQGNYDHFVTKPIFMVRSCYHLTLPQARGPCLVGCPWMLIQCICSYPPYWRPFLHLQPEDMPYHGDRYRIVMDINELSNCQLLVCACIPRKFPCVHDLWKMDLKSLVRLIHQLLHFHQFPCAKAPISFGSCFVLPVSPGIDGSLRIIWNYPEAMEGLHGFLSSSFLYSPLCSLVDIYFGLEYHGVEPKSEAVLASGVPSIHPSKSTLLVLDLPVYWTRPLSLFGLSLFCH
jgi:hypothetical protein